jgi:hypothetical protein
MKINKCLPFEFAISLLESLNQTEMPKNNLIDARATVKTIIFFRILSI